MRAIIGWLSLLSAPLSALLSRAVDPHSDLYGSVACAAVGCTLLFEEWITPKGDRT